MEKKKEKSEWISMEIPEIDYTSCEDHTILRGMYMWVNILIYYYWHTWHPCAYLKVKWDENSVYYENDEPCHWWITFSNYVDEDSKRAEWRFDKWFWIGWDYAHGGDYMRILWHESDKKRTTKEILKEIEEMIVYCKTKWML
jgi:hypothetical protein